LIESVVSKLWGKEIHDKSYLGWRLVLTFKESTGIESQFLMLLIEYLDKNQLNLERLSNGYSKEPKSESLEQQKHLALVHRASNLLVSIGYGVDHETDHKSSSHDNSHSHHSSSNNNNGIIHQVLFQGRVFGIGVLRTLICVQCGWPTSVKTIKGKY
jgi:hypothetical protein